MDNGNVSSSGWQEQMTAFLDRKGRSSADATAQVLYSYVGIIDMDKVHVIISEIEQLLIASEIPKAKVKKTFTILLEGLQNMAIHSVTVNGERSVGLELVKIDENIGIRILGVTDEKGLDRVRAAVDDLNQMERAEIKSHYLNVMDNGIISAKGGAGLGLITMVMKSDGGMEIEGLKSQDDLFILSHSLEV